MGERLVVVDVQSVSLARIHPHRRGIMKKWPELPSVADLKSTVLGEGLGAAFLLQPSTGTLQPFGEQIIEVTAYSDMWGKYCDNIICKVRYDRIPACV